MCPQIGVGLEGKIAEDFADVSWLYFPEEEYIFYRVTIMSNFAASMVPGSQLDKCVRAHLFSLRETHALGVGCVCA